MAEEQNYYIDNNNNNVNILSVSIPTAHQHFTNMIKT
jgi:hypothetical protein